MPKNTPAQTKIPTMLETVQATFKPQIADLANEIWSTPLSPQDKTQLAINVSGELIANTATTFVGEHFTDNLFAAAQKAAEDAISAQTKKKRRIKT